MTRRQAREHLFLMLFRIEFHDREELREQADFYLKYLENMPEEELASLKEDVESLGVKFDIKSLTEKETEELRTRFLEIVDRLTEIDETLSKISTGWTLDRMGKVDLTVMRIAVYEMKFDNKVPGPVSINEAVELAKKFGEETSGSFVNGVLAKLYR